MKIIRHMDDALLPLSGTAVALGMFDGLHRGHRAVLGKALDQAAQRELCPCVFTFALAEPPPSFKAGAAQLTTQRLMAKLLDRMGMRCAIAPTFEAVRGLSGEAFVKEVLLEKLGAKVIVCGFNFTFGKNKACKALDLARIAQAHGITCLVVPEVDLEGEAVSSTRIRACIVAGDISQANKLLGRQFTIDFEVVQGNRIGRTLGTPTINQPFPADFVIPRWGVYATVAKVDGTYYSGVTNVGVKPTVGSDVVLAETFLQGFSGDLYGRKIEVRFLAFIRPEQKFASIEELRANILRDAREAAKIAEPHVRELAQKQNERA